MAISSNTTLFKLKGHYKEYTNSKTVSEDDEGYEQEEEDSIGIDKAIEVLFIQVL